MDGDHLDVWSDAIRRDSQGARAASSKAPRPFLGVMFACCNVYSRVYRAPDGTAYRGGCPRCGRVATFRVGVGGSNSRFFQAE